MSNLSQQTMVAYEAGAGASMSDTYTVFMVILVGLLFLLMGYVVFILYKGWGEKSVQLNELSSSLIRGIVLICALIAFFYFS